MNFSLKRPCSDCLFRRKGAIALRPGRLDGIIAALTKDDYQCFPCHKVTMSKKGGEWVEDEYGEHYQPSGHEQACIGALVYQRSHLPVLARLAVMRGELQYEKLESLAEIIIPVKPLKGELHHG